LATVEERLTELEQKVTDLENKVITVSQYQALKTLYEQGIVDLRNDLANVEARFTAVERNQNAIQNARYNHRAEFKLATPVLVAGNTYELPDSYDPSAVFLVFNPVVKVVEANLTLAALDAVEPASKRFDSSVVLAANAVVIYFVKIPALNRPTFP